MPFQNMHKDTLPPINIHVMFVSDHLPPTSKNNLNNKPKLLLPLTLTLVFLTIYSLYYYSLLGNHSILYIASTPSTSPKSSHNIIDNPIKIIKQAKKCDIFRGEWVPNPNAPYYTNETCWAIHEHQNCMKFGRPDSEFMNWRWKPNDCELMVFNPAQFLEIMRGKSLAFVGDSVGRNQMQSLMCLLNRITYAVDISETADEKWKTWSYPSHNFTLANFWSPYLVKAKEWDPHSRTLTGVFNLYLDQPDPSWTQHIEPFHYVIVSAGHWFFRPTMYYQNNILKGCHYCLKPEIKDLTMYHGYRHAFRTTFQAINSMKNYKGTTILRAFAPSHFENGEWDKGGDCVRRKPLRSNETRLEGINLEMYMIQVEEFEAAEKEGRRKELKYLMLDSMEAMLMRPDGHPSRFGHRKNEKVEMPNDCVHWCLPGPIDVWNDFLLEMLKMEGGRFGSVARSLPQVQ